MGIIGDFRHTVATFRRAFHQEQSSDWASELFSDAARSVLHTQEISLALRHAGLDESDVLADLVVEGLRLQETEVLHVSDVVDVREVGERIVQAAQQMDWTDLAERRAMAIALIGLGAAVIALLVLAPLLPFVVALLLGLVLYVVRRRTGRRFSVQSEQQVHRLLLEHVRHTINETLHGQGREAPFHVVNAPALSELTDRAHIVATPSVRRITRQTETMAYGSVGIAGPRGVGKSALLAGFCDHRFARADSPELRVLISAPVEYDSREFLTHVFARLCEAIIASASPAPAQSRGVLAIRVAGTAAFLGGGWLLATRMVGSLPDEALDTAYSLVGFTAGPLALVVVLIALWYRRRPSLRSQERPGWVRRFLERGLLLAIAFGAMAVGVVAAAVLAQKPPPPVEPSQLWTPYTPGVLLLLATPVLFVLSRRLALRTETRPHSSAGIAESARAHLRRIRYVQTLTTGFSADLSAGAPLRLGRSRSREWAEHPPTLPQVVSQYREFATQAAQWWRHSNRGRGRIVIGIDEVDKIGGGESTQRFLNEVKAIFGTPHCMYLITVSEDALTRYELRSVAVRDAFDSAFDEIVRVERMSFAEVREMLTRRVTGLTDPLIALCYVLSGGLPRDCLRVARSLVEICREYGEHPADTAEFTKILVRREVTEIKNAVLRRLSLDRSQDSPSHPQPPGHTVDLLLDPAWPPLTPDGLADVDREPFTETDFAEFRSRIKFLRAVLKVFTTRQVPLVALLRDDPEATAHMLSRLAAARITTLGNLPTGPRFLRDAGLE